MSPPVSVPHGKMMREDGFRNSTYPWTHRRDWVCQKDLNTWKRTNKSDLTSGDPHHLTQILAFNLTYSVMFGDILAGILSGVLFDMFWHFIWHILLPIWDIFWKHILAFYLTVYSYRTCCLILPAIYSDIVFWHFICQPIWHSGFWYHSYSHIWHIDNYTILTLAKETICHFITISTFDLTFDLPF